MFFFDNILDPRRLLKWLFFRPLHAPLASFTNLKKGSRGNEFHERMMSESPAIGKIASKFVEGFWVSKFLTRYNSRHATEKSSND